MKVYDLTLNQWLPQGEGFRPESPNFIVATQQEFNSISQQVGISLPRPKTYSNLDENIQFESFAEYDYLSFVYFTMQDSRFIFETFCLYYSSRYLVLVVEKEEGAHLPLLEEFTSENLRKRTGQENLTYLYYRFMNNAFAKMFSSLSDFEETLAAIENDVIASQKDFDFQKIVDSKNNCFQVKKCMRLLLYVGDQLLVNDNRLIPEEDMKFFRNIDMRINRMYEYAANIHEVSEHLMELYNSTVTARTNDLINKLTIFTVFATPVTVLTGLYGMNFVNMPELQHPYGYYILLGVIFAILLTTYLILKKIKLL